MTEPDVALTDYALALECTVFAYLLQRKEHALFFGSAAIASLAGGTVHGFFLDDRTLGNAVLWRITLIAIGVTAASAWAIGARVLFPGPTAQRISIAAAAAFAAYCVVTVFITQEFLEAGTAIALAPYGCGEGSAPGVVVNDIHSQLNATRVHRIVKPASADAVVQLVRSAGQEGRPLSIAGGRHAMGGQQFGSETTLVDMGSMQRVLGFDAARGLIDVEAGIEWPQPMRYLGGAPHGAARGWGIPPKAT